MNFTEKTLSILKNFSTINPSIIIRPGSVLKTVSTNKTVMAVAKVDNDFDTQACVYDLSRFLSIYSLYETPEVEFQEKNFLLSEGKKKTKYVYADPSMIVAPKADQEVKLPSKDVTVEVEWADLQNVIKAAGVLQLPEIAFVGEGGKCYLKAINSKDTSADTFGLELGDTDDVFQLILKTENLKLIPGKYKVDLSAKGISRFEGADVTYYVAIESNSSYKKD